MILSTRYISSISKKYVALGTKSRLLDPTFSSSSELILLKNGSFIKTPSDSRFNDILLNDENILICGKENELVVYEILDSEYNKECLSLNKINDKTESDLFNDNHGSEDFHTDLSDEKVKTPTETATSCLKSLFTCKITVTSITKTPRNNLYLLVTDKLIFFDTKTLKLYNLTGNSGNLSIPNIKSVAYNIKVNHILAIVSDSTLIIYDLKRKEPVITKKMDNLGGCAWLPGNSTQILLLKDKTLFLLDLTSEKQKHIGEGFNGFKMICDEEDPSNISKSRLVTWNDHNLVKYRPEDFTEIENTPISDIYHYNEGNGMKIFAQTSSGTTLFKDCARGSAFLARENLILSQNRKLKVSGKVFDIKIDQQEQAKERVFKLISDDETVKSVFDDEIGTNITEEIPLTYFLTEDKALLLKNENYLSLLVLCKKENNWKYLIENKIVDYSEIIKYLQKNETVSKDILKDLIPVIIDNNDLNDHEIVDLYVLIGENNKSNVIKLKKIFDEIENDKENQLGNTILRFNRILNILQKNLDENILANVISELKPELSSAEQQSKLKWFIDWAKCQGKNEISDSFGVKSQPASKPMNRSQFIRPPVASSTQIPRPGSFTRPPPVNVQNTPRQPNVPPRIPNVTQNIPPTPSLSKLDLVPPTRPAQPPVTAYPSSQSLSTHTEAPEPKKKSSYADMMGKSRPMSAVPPRSGTRLPPQSTKPVVQKNERSSESVSTISPPTRHGVPKPPVPGQPAINRHTPPLERKSPTIPPPTRTPRTLSYGNRTPDQSAAYGQSRPAPPAFGLRSPNMPSMNRQANQPLLSDEEKVKINNIMAELTAFVRQESQKKNSILLRSRIRDALLKLNSYEEIQNENDLFLLKNLTQDKTESLNFIEEVYNGLECKKWVEGMVQLWRIIKK